MSRPSRVHVLSRRRLLAAAAGIPAIATMWPRLRLDLESPRLADPNILRFIAGIRPTRRGGVRLEREILGNKTVVHHYGHGGSGITLSWGSAEEAARIVAETHQAPSEIAVLGAGAVGLATARVLQEQGYTVTVLAKDFPPHTTSNLAGAVWHPGGILSDTSQDNQVLLQTMLKRSWARFRALQGEAYGIVPRDLYEHYSFPRLRASQDMPIRYERVDRLPFPGGDRVGHLTRTLLIQPPIYMAELLRQVLIAGGRLRRQEVGSPRDLVRLSQAVVVNCMGYGAKAVFGDEKVVAVRGQLVHLFPERLEYLLTGRHGYLFPRADAVVLGGTFEEGVEDPSPVDQDCERILAKHRRFFGS